LINDTYFLIQVLKQELLKDAMVVEYLALMVTEYAILHLILRVMNPWYVVNVALFFVEIASVQVFLPRILLLQILLQNLLQNLKKDLLLLQILLTMITLEKVREKLNLFFSFTYFLLHIASLILIINF
jgi:hypothetical protein